MNTFIVPELPPKVEIETRAVLRQTLLASRALAELKGVSRTIPNQSILINTFPPMFKNNKHITFEERQLKFPDYSKIMYDKFRKVYYRFAFPGNEYSNEPNLRQKAIYRPYFSIIILDENFNILGETVVTRNTFHERSSFINKDGLYISESHVLNPNFDENKLFFRLFTLEKDEN